VTPGLGTFRHFVRRRSDGAVESIMEKKTDTGAWVVAYDSQQVRKTPENLARERQLIQMGQQRRAQEGRDAKREKSQQRAAMFNSVVQGVAQGLAEVDTNGYAYAQANLDATVANIQYAAEAERQQQAQAQQQAQVRAAEEQRTQRAENARWVVEKEQAAADHQSRLVEAAAAREKAPVLAANTEAAAERARQAEVERQQSAGDGLGSVVSQKPPASAGTSLLGGPKESGRGGSTCNEEIACRKSCVGDVFAVTECVKQCARESACRVGVQ
jgi:hypothetical protein